MALVSAVENFAIPLYYDYVIVYPDTVTGYVNKCSEDVTEHHLTHQPKVSMQTRGTKSSKKQPTALHQAHKVNERTTSSAPGMCGGAFRSPHTTRPLCMHAMLHMHACEEDALSPCKATGSGNVPARVLKDSFLTT